MNNTRSRSNEQCIQQAMDTDRDRVWSTGPQATRARWVVRWGDGDGENTSGTHYGPPPPPLALMTLLAALGTKSLLLLAARRVMTRQDATNAVLRAVLGSSTRRQHSQLVECRARELALLLGRTRGGKDRCGSALRVQPRCTHIAGLAGPWLLAAQDECCDDAEVRDARRGG